MTPKYLTIKNIRIKNLIQLIRKHSTQTALAEKLPNLSQVDISNLKLGKSPFTGKKARDLETALGIPEGWMDKDDSVKNAWNLILEFRTLDNNGRSICNRIASFYSQNRTRSGLS